jgi:argininosuccinate lyase
MKLWDKGISIDKRIEQFTVGNDRELDLFLAKYDLIASMAHARMLGKIGLLKEEEVRSLIDGLESIASEVAQGSFVIEDTFEDVHSKIEYLLTSRLGDTGKKIHTARSRNDQVLVAMQLFLKEEINELKTGVKALFDLLISLASKYKSVLLPGYTHLQVAMPSSFGLWFSAYAESLVDDMYLLNAAYKTADQNPLGSAAGYGSSFPIDRKFTTDELGFRTMKFNVVAAQMGRGKVEKATAFGLSSTAATLSRLAMDICLYMSQNFNFISFPESLTTGSSIMPHKKNPDVFELIRARCNRLQSVPGQLALLTTNLPSGYHRDLQLVKEIILPALQDMKACLDIMVFSLREIRVSENILDDPKYDYLFSVETLNEFVKEGIPFRDAYRKMGDAIREGSYVPKKEVQHTHEGSIGNLCLDEIRQKMEEAI